MRNTLFNVGHPRGWVRSLGIHIRVQRHYRGGAKNAKRGAWRLPACFFRRPPRAEGVAGGRAPQERSEYGGYLKVLCPVESYKILRAIRLQAPCTPTHR